MTTPAVQRHPSARSDVPLYALLELSKALSSEFNLDRLLAVIVEKASAVVEAESTRVVLEVPAGADRNLTNSGTLLRAPIIDSRGNLLGIIESTNKKTKSSFDAHDESLMHAMAAHIAVAIERARLTDMHFDFRLASEIQMRMLPSGSISVPVGAPFALHTFIRPAKHVGGDLYDFSWNDDRLFFCIGDVTGKGIGAALVMAMTKTLFRAHAALQSDPAQVLSAVNARLYEETDPAMFVTAFCGFLDLRDGRLRYSNAGHEPPLLRTRGAALRLQSKAGLPLGVMPSFAYVIEEKNLQAGDSLLLYTDGVTDASNRSEALFSAARLREVVERCTDSRPSSIVSDVAAAVDRFAEGAAQADDIAMLCVQYHGARVEQTFRRDIAELENVFALVGRFFAKTEASDATRYAVQLAAEEIFTNLLRHNPGGGDRIEIALRLDADDVALSITDFNAPPFDIGTDGPSVDPNQALDERTPGGLGLFLVKSMMDRVAYRYENGNGTVTLYKRRSA